MSIQASFSALKSLQVLDTRIAKLEVELATERAGISDKAERHVGLLERIAKIETVVGTMETTKHELNQELRQHTLQVDKAREKMARCRNEREANAAQREMEEVRRLSRERELEIQKLAGLIADARADAEKLESERGEVAGQIDETEGQAATKVRDLQKVLDEQKAKRSHALDQLPSHLQKRYGAVHGRRGSGAAAIIKGSCTACHISLSPMLFQEIMRLQEVFQCPSCHRLLYVDERPVDDSSENEETDASANALED